MFPQLGKTLLLIGSILIILGVILTFLDKIPYIGKLPGDIYLKKGNLTFYFPLTTAILISILISLILNLIGKR